MDLFFPLDQYILDLVYRGMIDLITIFIIARLIYYPIHKNKDFLFTFILFNIVIFFLCALLSNTQIEMSFTFGLFAIFSILRYRTVTIPVREMGYFFLCVAVGIFNSLFSNGEFILFLLNLLFIIVICILEKNVKQRHENFKLITLNQLDLINEDQKSLLTQELKDKIGIEFHKIEIHQIDFSKQTAQIKAYYFSNSVELSTNKNLCN